MTDRPTLEGNSPTAEAKQMNLGNLVALEGAVYRILSRPSDCALFIEAENIETFERVILTTAAIPKGFPITSATQKRNRRRRR